MGNAGLIKKVYFPRDLLVMSVIGSLLVSMLIEMSVVIVILLIAGNFVIPWIPMVLVLIALESLLVLGVGLFLSVANVYFRDVKHFIAIALQALFYATPIVYPDLRRARHGRHRRACRSRSARSIASTRWSRPWRRSARCSTTFGSRRSTACCT